MSAYVNNLSACGLLCGHNFLLSMTCIMKLIFKNFHILCTLCNYERAMSNLGQATTFRNGERMLPAFYSWAKCLKILRLSPNSSRKLRLSVLSRKLRNFNILRISYSMDIAIASTIRFFFQTKMSFVLMYIIKNNFITRFYLKIQDGKVPRNCT